MIINQPVITEKSLRLAQDGVYTFVVDRSATKPEIAKALTKLYGVAVATVNLASVKGKTVRRKTGIGHQNNWKKAMITLEKGQQIKDFALAEEAHTHDKDKKEEKK